MSPLTHAQVISSIPKQFERAKASGALLFYPSTTHRVVDHNFNFEISTCPALQKKPTLPAPDFVKHDKPDPFAPPYVEDLHVGDLKDQLDGDEFVILLNKFSVVPGHFLMVTKDFHPQDSPLTPPELTQAYLLIRAARKTATPIFAFYNCGKDSGASQPHKHIQFIPTRRDEGDGEEEDDEEEESASPPAEAFVARCKIEDDTKTFSLPLPYVHLVRKLDLSKAAATGTKPLSEDALEELGGKLTDAFLGLLDEAIHATRLYDTHDKGSADKTQDARSRVASPSYNILLTSEHMHLIPRRREYTTEELHPVPDAVADSITVPDEYSAPEPVKEADGEAAYTPQKLSVNSLGFAGMLLAKSDPELRAIRARGVVRLLTQVGVPRVEVEEESEGTLA
ncbi:HIT-like protein [Ceratobasidium sp. AG-I]|nr:HIT-like protein [Ceratobasidium sp. AG-I]